MKVHGLYDCDQALYMAGFGAQQVVYQLLWEGQVVHEEKYMADAKKWIAENDKPGVVLQISKYTDPGPVEHSLHNLKALINSALDSSGCDTYKMYMSKGSTFRDTILDNADYVYAGTNKVYKGNRIDAPKPRWFNEMMHYITQHYDVRVCEDIEADDAVSIQQTRYADKGMKSIIISADKDLNTVPGMHYNPQKDVKYYVDEDAADEWFWCQMLIGDSADNIAGLPGVGVRAAYNILEDCCGFEERRKAVMSAYYKYWNEEQGIEFNTVTDIIRDTMNLLWMLRSYETNKDGSIKVKW